MKNTKSICLICVMLCCAICHGAEVTIAGDDYPLVFRDTTVNTNNQERIASDLTLALAYIDSITNAFDFIITDEYGNSYFEQPSVSCSEIVRFLRFDTNVPCKLVVEKELSDKYIAQFAKIGPYTNILAQVDGFIAQFSSGAVTNFSAAEQRSLVIEPRRGVVDYPDDDIKRIMVELVNKHYYAHPIIWFETVDIMSDGQKLPFSIITFSRWRGRKYIHDALPIVYYNGAWRFLSMTE